MKMLEEDAKLYYPAHIKPQLPNPLKLKYLIMAPPKWGKTTFFSGANNALLLAFEEGHGSIAIPKIVITGWDLPIRERGPSEDEETGIIFASASEVADALESYCPYSFIIVDTVDQAVKMCADYECEKGGIRHPSDGGDFGKGWDLYQTSPFRRFYNRLVKLGVGVALTTHVQEEWKKDQYKQDVFRRETTLPGGIQKFVHAQSDVIINGMWGKRRSNMGHRDRIISFDGTNEIMAGSRIRGVRIPIKYIVDPPTEDDLSLPWQQWNDFFIDSPQAGEAATARYQSIYTQRRNEPIDDDNNQIIELPLSNKPPEKGVYPNTTRKTKAYATNQKDTNKIAEASASRRG
jgi:hypothetical protein